MAGAVEELRRHGLVARIASDGRLQAGPVSRLTPEAHALVARLAQAIRGEIGRFRAWRVQLAPGKSMTIMSPQGMTHGEAITALEGHPHTGLEPLWRSEVLP